MKDLTRIQVNPNPVPQNTGFTISLPSDGNCAERYKIMNDEGRIVRQGHITAFGREVFLSTGGMEDGVYWLEVGEDRQRITII